MWSKRAARAGGDESVDDLRREVDMLRQVIRQLVLQQGLYKAEDPEAAEVVRLLSQLEVAHPRAPVSPARAQPAGLDEPTSPISVASHVPAFRDQ
jgi:hypothetical protein